LSLHEADIRPADLLAEYLRLNAEDGRRLLNHPEPLEERPCPGCRGDASNPAFRKNGFSLVRCAECDSLYVTPAPSPKALGNFYRDSSSTNYWANVFFPAVAEARRKAIYRPRAERVAGIAAEHGIDVGAVVDVGAGFGLFLEEFRALVPTAMMRAVEPGRAHAAQLASKGFETFEGYAQDAAADPAWRDGADVVTLFEVLEHLLEPQAVLMRLANLVRPGGLILVSGLCGDGFDIRVLGERSKPVSPPHHLTFLSIAGAEMVIERCGLELFSITTPGELDVDIVRNAALEKPECVEDPVIRRLVLEASDEERQTFQESLKQSRQSSHMWIVVRRPEGNFIKR
jgi:SAM-dependent methyltransferase